MMKHLVSILIPAFNSEKWIVDTIHSAIAQTWQRKEIIIVDDGSCDATLAIGRQFEATDVCVVSQENQGAAAARNKALSLSQGDYIQWPDADDLLAPTKIAAQMEILRLCPNNRSLVTSAWGRFMYRYNRAEWISSALWCDLFPTEWLLRKIGQNIFMQTWTWLGRVNTNGHFYAILRTWKSPTHSIATSRHGCRRHAATSRSTICRC